MSAKLNDCLLKHAKAFKDFDNSEVIEAAKAYQSRGETEDAANLAAIEDHLRELMTERDRIETDIIEQWKQSDPKGYEKKKAAAEAVASIQNALSKSQKKYTRAEVEALDFDGMQKLLNETGGVAPAWLPVTSTPDAYLQEYGERSYSTAEDASKYARGLELGEGGAWTATKVGQGWRAKRVPTPPVTATQSPDAQTEKAPVLAEDQASDPNVLNQSVKENAWPIAAVAWQSLAGNEDVFRLPAPKSFDMAEIAQEIDPGMTATEDTLDPTDEKHLSKKWFVKMTDGTHAYVMENPKGEVWLDASRLSEGKSGGTKLYLLVGSYAEGNGKVFIGDPAGLSDVALLRRTENMISLALRYGHTDFMMPHEFQMNPDAKDNTVLKDVVRPIEWVVGDDKNNLGELLKTGYDNTVNLVPEIKDVTYNFNEQRFERNDGRALGDEYFNGLTRGLGDSLRKRGLGSILGHAVGNAGRNERAPTERPPIGIATLKRAAITNTVLRAARSGTGRELLAEISRVVSGRLDNSQLSNILYQSQTPADAGVSASGAGELFSRDRLAEFDPTALTITMLKGANLSSVLHESGHFYLTAMTRIAAREGSSQAIKDDVDKTMLWFGIPGDTPEARLAKWLSMSTNEQREHHEQWAESNERWMLEGKAPAVEMQSIFARFRSWMLSVYKSMEEFLIQNPRAGKLNDEMRGVFGRMLASEEAIKFAEQTRGYAALFQNEQEAGVSPEVFRDYVQLGEEATLAATAQMQNRSLRDIRWLSNAKDKAIRTLQLEGKDFRKAIREEVTKEVMAEPINQARTFLTKGETTDPVTGEQVKVLKGYKLDTAMVKEMYPETGLANPDLTKLRGMTGTDGIHPDLAAQMFGLSSGDALVRELIDGEKSTDKINGLVDKRMLEDHGELVDPRSIELAAESAIHNEARARFLATGLKLLTKTPGSARDISKAAKMAAEQAIAAKKVRDLRPLQYTAAEARSNKEAVKSAVSDPQKAVQSQRAALLNNRLASAAADAVEEVQQIVRYLKKFENTGTRKAIDLDYLEQIEGLLAPFNLSTGISLTEIDRRKSLTAWVADQEALGFQPAIDTETIERAKLKSYKDMTVEELRGFVDSIKQVEHMGRLKKKLLTSKDKREFATRMVEADNSIRANANRTVEETATATDVTGRLAEIGKMILSAHRKFSSFMREMDGGKDGGAMWELFSRPMNEAGDNETSMRADAAREMAAIFAPIQSIIRSRTVIGNLYARKQLVPGTNFSMTHEQRVMFAMNWGNDGNRQRLLDGGLSGKRAMSQRDAQAILDTLTKEEWNFVQSTLDYIGSYKDRIAELERTLTGVEPNWVAPSPINTKFGSYAGGYFPAKYDARLSMRSAALEAMADLRQAMKGAFGAAATKHGYTKDRAEAVIGRPLLLSYDVIPAHVNEVIHRLSWQPWLTDATRSLRALEDPIRAHYGPEVLNQLHKTVEAVAVGDVPATEAVDIVLNHLRIGSTIVGMGWRVMTGLMQPSGLAQSWERVGTKWVAKGVAEFVAHPFEAAELVNDKSSFMRDRSRTMQREINEIVNTLRVGKELSAVKLSYFTFIAKMQKGVDIPTWLGANEKALAEMGYENAKSEEERKSMEERAIALADQAVRDSQGSGLIADLAGVQRGHPAWKLFTNFYSYFSTTYNRNAELFRRTDFKSPTELAMFAADFAIINALPALFSFALKEMLKGDCGDDIECLAANYAHEQAGYMFGQMLPLREVGAAFNLATGGPNFGYTGPAGVRFMADITNFAAQTGQGELDLAFWKAANRVGGGLFHYPAGQLNATLDGIVAIENGEVEGAAVLPALLVGPPHK